MGTPILRTHLHVSWAPINRSRKRGHALCLGAHNLRVVGRPYVVTCAPNSTMRLGTHKRPQIVSTQPHEIRHPDIPTRPHIGPRFWAPKQRVNSHVSGKLWAPTNYAGLPRNCATTHEHGCPMIVSLGRPCVMRGLPRVIPGRSHNTCGHPTYTKCTPTRFYGRSCETYGRAPMFCGLPRVICVCPRISCGRQRIAYGSTHVMSGRSRTISGHPTRYAWSPKHVAIFTHFGRPLIAGWAPTRFRGRAAHQALDTHEYGWMVTHLGGCPCLFRGHQRNSHGRPRKIWSLMRFAGCPRNAIGHPHGTLWARMAYTCTPKHTQARTCAYTTWGWARMCRRTLRAWARMDVHYGRTRARNGNNPLPKG